VLAGGEAVEVLALGVPDPRLGQAIIVVARANGDAAEAEARLRERLRRDLPSFMQPGRYEWWDAIPRNANGKLDRAAITRAVRPERVEGLPFPSGQGEGQGFDDPGSRPGPNGEEAGTKSGGGVAS
jgi:acyl-CoA synthetase (AMP-forming)/AMP-acid ligase II